MRRAMVVTFLLVLAAGQLGVGMRAADTASITGDEPFYVLTAQSLSSDLDLDLRDEYAGHEERRFWDGTIPLWQQMRPTADGRLLAPHDPGLSLLITPAYMAAGLEGVQRFLVILWALACALAVVVAVRWKAPPAAAAVAAIAVGAGAPGVVYASQVYPEGPAALAVAIGLVLVTGSRPRAFAMAAVCLSLAWLGVKYGPIVAVLAGAWAWRFRAERRALAIVATIGAVGVLHFAWWHLHTFDGLTPYTHNVVWSGEGTATIVADHLDWSGRPYRLYGVFLDARFGLLRWSPIAALLLWGVARRTALATAILATSVLTATFLSITIMGWWFPGRMLVVAFPAVIALTSQGVARLPRISMALAVWSLAIGAAVVLAAKSSRLLLAIDPWTVGPPLPPAWLFPDFRSIDVTVAAHSSAWGLALILALWRSSSSSTATRSATARSSPSRPTSPPPRGR